MQAERKCEDDSYLVTPIGHERTSVVSPPSAHAIFCGVGVTTTDACGVGGDALEVTTAMTTTVNSPHIVAMPPAPAERGRGMAK